MELRTKEKEALDRLWTLWSKTPDTELEATLPTLDYTRFLNAIKHLRSLGLKEEPQEVKLNIMLPNHLRFTLVGEAVIQAYCRDNTLQGKPFHVLLKDKHILGNTDVDLRDYDVRIKIRREQTVPLDDPRVAQALAKWSTIPKTFRYMTRIRFSSTKYLGIVFDASFVKQSKLDTRGSYIPALTFLAAEITRQPIRYEMEVEATGTATQASLLTGIVHVLRGIQKSYVLVRREVREHVLTQLYTQTQTPRGKFPGPKSVTLTREHMGLTTEPDTPNIRYGDYNITDKADGSRALLVVARNGHIYLVDNRETVYATNRRLDAESTAEFGGAILDGEWVTHDKTGKSINHYYAFDIFNGRKGEDVTARPFLVRAETGATRLAALTDAVGTISKAMETVAHIPDDQKLKIDMKTFQTTADPTDPVGIFHIAAEVLDRVAATAPYHTDGLIFTPNAMPMMKFGTWKSQLKWKPASQNSVDFLVITEKELDKAGRPTQVDAKIPRDNGSEIVISKALGLFVASSADPALEDPRDTVLNNRPYPSARGNGYRKTIFSPEPPDPMAAVCYVAINAGAIDAAGASAATSTLRLGNSDDSIACVGSGDPIRSHTIVEMVYHPERAEGWRWEPMRVRWDKTEQFHNGDMSAMNNERVANDIWKSIHEPVTEYMIRNGSITQERMEATGAAAGTGTYYKRKPSQRDLFKVRGLADFHNQYVKTLILLSKTIRAGSAVLDMSVGQAGDLHKWIHARVGWVLGCDIALTGLTDNKNGAYRRYLEQKSRHRVPPMLFVQADSTKPYADGSAGITPLDRTLLRTLWGENEESAPPAALELRGRASKDRFDVASLMFTLHYFFEDVGKVNGWLKNLASTVKVGGFFVGCCFDGDEVLRLLRQTPVGGVKRGVEDETDVWTIKRLYEDDMVTLPTTDAGVGKAIDVNFASIGAAHTEYLVSFPYLTKRLADIGFELLTPAECGDLGLQDSTNLFRKSYDMAAAAGYNYPMSETLKDFSFLNRWFIFRRKSVGKRGEGEIVGEPLLPLASEELSLVDAPPVSLASFAPDVVQEASAAPALDLVEAGDAESSVTAPTLELVEPSSSSEAGASATEASAAESSAAASAAASGTEASAGPIFQFYHRSAQKDDFKRKDPHWRRHLSTYAPFNFVDKDTPSVTYPTFEAVLGAEKFKVATNKKELGPQLFGSLGTIHQSVVTRLAAASKQPIDKQTDLLEEQGDAQRDAQKAVRMKDVGAKWTGKLWDSAAPGIMTTYLRQRLEKDEHFRRILKDVKAVNGVLVYHGGGDLGGKVSDDTVTGENQYGKALMSLFPLL